MSADLLDFTDMRACIEDRGGLLMPHESRALLDAVEAAHLYSEALDTAAKARVAGHENEYHQIAVNARDISLRTALAAFAFRGANSHEGES